MRRVEIVYIYLVPHVLNMETQWQDLIVEGAVVVVVVVIVNRGKNGKRGSPSSKPSLQQTLQRLHHLHNADRIRYQTYKYNVKRHDRRQGAYR